MDIISYCSQKIADTATEILSTVLDGKCTFTECVTAVDKMMSQLSVKLIEDILAETESAIYDSTERKERYSVTRLDSKVISTIFGDVTLKRRYYQEKSTKKHIHLLDELLQITPHQRMDEALEAKIYEKTTEMSYQKSIDSFDKIGIHSKQTVKNIVWKYRVPEEPYRDIDDSHKKIVPYLYIEADEDHIHLQDGKSSNDQMLLVYVHEGMSRLSTPKRHQLNVQRYFTGLDSEKVWDEVGNYIESNYNTEKIEHVYLSGDGASWIQKGLEVLPKQTEFVLDPFHTKQSIKRLCTGIPRKEIVDTIYSWILGNKIEYFEDFYTLRLSDEAISEASKKVMKKEYTYLTNHWESIRKHKDGHYIGCSAEGHVSHCLSSRISSRPYGWKKTGVENVAKMRIALLNGEKTDEIIRKINDEKRVSCHIKELDKRIKEKAQRKYIPVIGTLPLLKASVRNTGRKAIRGLCGY